MLHLVMKYSLSSTIFIIHECVRVDRSYLPTLLSRMGFNQCTKQLLLFWPPSLGLVGFTNKSTNQGIAQIQLFLGHLRKNEEIGVLTNILLETLQLVIGSSFPLFHYPLTQVLRFCTRNWLLNVWEFLISIHGTIHLERAWKFELQCTNNVFLMDSFMMHVPHFPPKTLKCLNACCIFLQVITLADITDRSGTHILPSSLQGIRYNDRPSYYMWLHQIRPSLEAWRTWHKTLCTQFFAWPVNQTDCRDPLESGNTMDLSIRSGHTLLTYPPTTYFKDWKELEHFCGSYLHTHPEYSTLMQSLPFLVHYLQFQSQWPIRHHNS
jgi:hypothetical protein